MNQASPGSCSPESGAGRPLDENRRPIRSRDAAWARAAASRLAGLGVSPNQISLASVLAAGLATLSLSLFPQPWLAVGCVAGVQLRLLCNLLDGMVAVEHGRKTPLGVLYNEFPDRVADSVILVALGYACEVPWLGWLSALGAALTAYVRVFGGALGFSQDFRGPMAKQHRMAVLTVGCVISILENLCFRTRYSLVLTCGLITAGSLVTCWTRTRTLARKLWSGS
jgi:phosphatidylglycerophosphate synthase